MGLAGYRDNLTPTPARMNIVIVSLRVVAHVRQREKSCTTDGACLGC